MRNYHNAVILTLLYLKYNYKNNILSVDLKYNYKNNILSVDGFPLLFQ